MFSGAWQRPGCEPVVWTAETRLIDEAGMDSLDVCQCVLEVEREFDVIIDNRRLVLLLTPADVAREVDALRRTQR